MRALSFAIRTGGLLLGLAGIATELEAQAIRPAEVLTNVAQVRELAPLEAARKLPVSLTGVVMDNAAPNRQAVVLADQTAGIYVLAAQNLFTNCHRGDLLEIKGVTDPGQFAPIVQARTMRKLGTGAIPEAQRVNYQQLITGALDGQWVEIKGVVRQCFQPAPKSDIWRIIVAADGGLVPVRFITQPGTPIETDAEVCVHAICYYQFNQKRQVLSPVLQVPRDTPVLIEKPAPTDPYALPLRAANSLLKFSPENTSTYLHRIHVRGVVTCSQPDAAVWIRDGISGLRIQTRQTDALQPGDQIEALGFLSFGSHTPSLEDSVFKKTGLERPPTPLALTNYDEAFNHEDDLVEMDATLAQIQTSMNEVAFTLDRDGKMFKGVLKLAPAGAIRPDWQVGCRVRLTGICSLIYDESRPLAGVWQPQSFQIFLRSPADLSVLKPPPWWTPKHIIFLLGGAALASLLVTGWAVMLSRRRLREQEHQRLMAEAEFAAILTERNRVAREIHDTLAQGLAATSVQLRLAKKHANGAAGPIGQHLDTAQQLVRESLEEARNSIWNMRSHVLETGDLADALKDILKQMAEGTKLETRFDIMGRARRLAPVLENNILRVGQEAITNATKHAGASRIKVTLEYGERQFRLWVTDDGRGFNPGSPPPSHGGFGLVGMRERAAEMKGELQVHSAPDQGTEIILSLPLSG